ncbi:flagellar biosynthesis protein FlhG [Variovorax sp. YR216]|uniref:nucleotide-binding protein n=1 Tax=Variovorax sp. YR216 TaxID=1882828 RepID=UPI000897D04F|nr:flagellar biosynthesis protein FlhG [Variovorax sp. YR216]SEA42962.1 flagellar biosynthesis protein FlhG [Variovorax sp. YR216]
MSKLVADQADGLRRLLANTPTRVIAIAGMSRGDGGTTTAMNLAAALVHQGKDVSLIDEQDPDRASAGAAWGVDVPGRAAECGVEVLPSPHPSIDPRTLRRSGVVLIDAALDDEGRLSPLAQRADELVLVLQPSAASITAAYAGIKRLHYAHGLMQIRFLVNRASGIEEAQKIMSNLANTGSRYLAVSLEPAGWVHADAHHADARRLGRTVVEAFPASPAAVDFRRIAADVLRWPWRTPARTVRSNDHAMNDSRIAMSAPRALHMPSAAVA